MLISRKSRRSSKLFESRFRDGAGVDFPLRQYLRCREEFLGGLVYAALLTVFSVSLLFFCGTVSELFANHGAHLNPWFHRLALAMVLAFFLVVLRRVFGKLRELGSIRREMHRLKSEFRTDSREDGSD